jgi:gliding motility-associated-like protein
MKFKFMKKIIAFFAFTLITLPIFSQIICINCYDQTAQLSPAAPNMILNPSFETNTCSGGGQFCPNSSSFNCSIDNWIASGGGTNTYAQMFGTGSSIIPNGITAAYLGNYFCLTCSTTLDDTACIIKNGCEVTGIPAGFPQHDPQYGGGTGMSIEQTVGGLVIGSTYFLEFWTGGEGSINFFQNQGMFGLDIGFGYKYLLCNHTEGGSTSTGIRYLVQFKPTSTSHTFKWTNWGHICSTCTELVLDDVKLYKISDLNPAITPCGPVDTIKNVLIDTTFCEGNSIVANGKTYSASGIYKDSIIFSPTNKTLFTIKINAVQCYFTTSVDTTICILDSVLFNNQYYNLPGTYIDTIKVSNFNFQVSKLTIYPKPCFDIYIPNVFSPNNDNRNDVFAIKYKNLFPTVFTFRIYNRFGEMVFESKDKDKGWNGLHNGKPAEIGTYFYAINVNVEGVKKTYVYKGDVTLVR